MKEFFPTVVSESENAINPEIAIELIKKKMMLDNTNPTTVARVYFRKSFIFKLLTLIH